MYYGFDMKSELFVFVNRVNLVCILCIDCKKKFER